MAKLTIYLRDELAAEAKAAELNISRLAQEAVSAALRTARSSTWLERMRQRSLSGVSSQDTDRALGEVRSEWDA